MIGLDTNVLVRFVTRDDGKMAQRTYKIVTEECTEENPGFVSTIVLVRNKKLLHKRLKAIREHPKDGVHDARVLAKILRAGLRYYDPKLEKYKDLDWSLRDLTRHLSAVREAEARRELLEWLEKEGIKVTVSTTTSKEIETDEVVVKLAGKLHQVFDELQKRTSNQGKEAWKRLQKALEDYCSDSNVKNLHAVRKKTKCLEYQLLYFSSDQRPDSSSYQDLHRASEKLGRAHDLAALVEEVDGSDREVLCEILKKQEQGALQCLEKLEQLEQLG